MSHSPDFSGLTASTSPLFLDLQDSTQVRSGSYSPENLNPQTSSPSLRFRRRASHVAASQHSPPASSPSYAPSPYVTSPTESTTLTSPQPSFYSPIVPHPDQSKTTTRADNDRPNVSSRKKRRSRQPSPSYASSPSPPGAAPAFDIDREQLTPADALLVRLREDEGLAWRDVAARLGATTGRDLSVAALQMRLKRLRERARPWTERDVAALRLAHDYWISHKFEIIAAKVRALPILIMVVPCLTPRLDDGFWRDGGLDGQAVREEAAADGVSDVAYSGESGWCDDLIGDWHFQFVVLKELGA